MAYRSSLDAKMSQSKCIGVWGMPHSQSVHWAWLPGTASMCPVEYVRYWFIEYDSSSSSFLYIVHTTYVCTCMLRAHVNVTCVSEAYLYNLIHICTIPIYYNMYSIMYIQSKYFLSILPKHSGTSIEKQNGKEFQPYWKYVICTSGYF